MSVPWSIALSFIGGALSVALLMRFKKARGAHHDKVKQAAQAQQDQQVDDQVRQMHERYLQAMDSVEEGLWDLDLQTGAIYVSQTWAQSLGYRDEKAYNSIEQWRALIHPDDAHKSQQALQAHAQGLSPVYDIEYRIKTAAGDWLWLASRGKILKNAYGTPIRIVGIHHDIQQKKLAEEALARAFDTEKRLSRLKSDFVTMLSHELRTPLTVLVSSRALLGASLDSGVITRGSLNRYLNQMDHSISRLRTLVEETMAYVHIDSSLDSTHMGQVDVVSIIKKALQEVELDFKNQQNLAPSYRISTVLDTAFSRVDEASLYQVLKHLFLHIAHWTAEQSMLNVEISQTDEMIVMQLREYSEDQAHMDQLDIFKNNDAALPQNPDLMVDKLGLVIIRRLVERMGGSISAKNANRGFNIIVEIPKG